jgi:hypothetical protein
LAGFVAISDVGLETTVFATKMKTGGAALMMLSRLAA